MINVPVRFRSKIFWVKTYQKYFSVRSLKATEPAVEDVPENARTPSILAELRRNAENIMPNMKTVFTR